MPNMVLSNGRKSGIFTKMQGYPPLDKCIKECCKTPTCDLLFKSGEVRLGINACLKMSLKVVAKTLIKMHHFALWF